MPGPLDALAGLDLDALDADEARSAAAQLRAVVAALDAPSASDVVHARHLTEVADRLEERADEA